MKTQEIRLFDKVMFPLNPEEFHYGEIISASIKNGRCLVSGYGPPILIANVTKISEDEYQTALKGLEDAE